MQNAHINARVSITTSSKFDINKHENDGSNLVQTSVYLKQIFSGLKGALSQLVLINIFEALSAGVPRVICTRKIQADSYVIRYHDGISGDAHCMFRFSVSLVPN